MKKDPNSRADPVIPDRSLPRSAILRGQRNFQRLFERATILRAPSIHLRYRVYDDPAEGFLIGFIVKKSLGKAVERNKTKRLLREEYRKHRYLLADFESNSNFGLHGAFMAGKTGLSAKTVREEMASLIGQLRTRLIDRTGTRQKETNESKQVG